MKNIFLFIPIICISCNSLPQKHIIEFEEYIRLSTAIDMACSQSPFLAEDDIPNKEYVKSLSDEIFEIAKTDFARNTPTIKELLIKLRDKRYVGHNDFFKRVYHDIICETLKFYDIIPIELSEFKEIEKNLYSTTEQYTQCTYLIQKSSSYHSHRNDSHLKFSDVVFEGYDWKNKIIKTWNYIFRYRWKQQIFFYRVPIDESEFIAKTE